MKFTKTLLTSTLFALSVTATSPITYANQNDDVAKQAFIAGGEKLEQALEAADKGDFHTSFKLFQSLAEQGNAAAQFLLAASYEDGKGVKQDYQQAAKWYQLAAEQGIVQAQLYLGGAYYNGKGVKQDYAQAVKWFRKAAAQGDAKALALVGGAYLKGEGVMQDKAKAKDYFGRSCEAGYQLGCDVYHLLNEGK